MHRDARDVPELGADVVAASADGLVVRVRRAQDVELEGPGNDDGVVPPATVRVAITVGAAPATGATVRGHVDVVSGFPTVGDADHEDVVELGARTVDRAGRCGPRDAAEDVHVWFTPTSAHSSVSSPRYSSMSSTGAEP